MLRYTVNLTKFGVFRPSFLLGSLLGIGIAALPMGLNPHHVEKFRECRLTDVGESELTDKKKKHAQNIRSRSQNGRSKN